MVRHAAVALACLALAHAIAAPASKPRPPPPPPVTVVEGAENFRLLGVPPNADQKAER